MEHDRTMNDLIRDQLTRIPELPASIQLRRVRHHPGMSEETLCFEAEVWIDGVKAGEVQNTGKGGGHTFHPYALEHALERLSVAHGFGDPDAGAELAGEFFFDRLLARHDLDVELGKRLEVGMLYLDATGRMLESKPASATKAQARELIGRLVRDPAKNEAALRTKLGAETILNFIPRPEALNAYARAQAALVQA